MAEVINLADYLEDADWLKDGWDFASDNVEDLRKELAELGIDVEHFKTLPAYTLALPSQLWLLAL